MTRFNKIYNLILEELTAKQKELTDKYTAKRDQNLSFGPLFKEERTYFPLKSIKTSNIEIPNEIEKILDNAGFYITDYRAGIAMKKTKPGEEKDLRQIKIGKILSKLNQPNLLKQFNERLGTSKKDIQNIDFEICITYNPYDIAGMSTDRNWTSCMELDKGVKRFTPLLQVQYGGMCTYLISADDKNIEQPFARIAIKRFISRKDSSKFIFLAEKTIYGDIDLAKELNFQKELIEILEKSNELTTDISGNYFRDDKNSYSDTYNSENHLYFTNKDIEGFSENQFKHYIAKSTENVPCKLIKHFIQKYPTLLNDKMFLFNIVKVCNDADLELISIVIKNTSNPNLIYRIIMDTTALSNKDAIKLLKKFKDYPEISSILVALIEHHYPKSTRPIMFTSNDLKYILDNFFDVLTRSSLYVLLFKYNMDNNLKNIYLPKILKKYPDLKELPE